MVAVPNHGHEYWFGWVAVSALEVEERVSAVSDKELRGLRLLISHYHGASCLCDRSRAVVTIQNALLSRTLESGQPAAMTAIWALGVMEWITVTLDNIRERNNGLQKNALKLSSADAWCLEAADFVFDQCIFPYLSSRPPNEYPLERPKILLAALRPARSLLTKWHWLSLNDGFMRIRLLKKI